MSDGEEVEESLAPHFDFNEGWGNGMGIVVMREEESEKQVLRYAQDDTR